ncbi:hypothetical protein KUA24_130 [Vibrio phage HNL01]|nr:hypothetical protein KUA24_130 [Vibrio phage HNL01]
MKKLKTFIYNVKRKFEQMTCDHIQDSTMWKVEGTTLWRGHCNHCDKTYNFERRG